MSTILHIEDNPVEALAYRSALTRAGYQVVSAEDGVVASKILHQTRPDLVILDLLMPKFGGADVLKFIRGTPSLKALPVIVLSGVTFSDDGEKARELGVARIFYKAECTPALLIRAIQELLGPQTV